jgi:hypothetical protein
MNRDGLLQALAIGSMDTLETLLPRLQEAFPSLRMSPEETPMLAVLNVYDGSAALIKAIAAACSRGLSLIELSLSSSSSSSSRRLTQDGLTCIMVCCTLCAGYMDWSILRRTMAGFDPKMQQVELAVAAQSTGALSGRGWSTSAPALLLAGAHMCIVCFQQLHTSAYAINKHRVLYRQHSQTASLLLLLQASSQHSQLLALL